MSSQNFRGVWLHFPTGAPVVICVCSTYGGHILQWYISLFPTSTFYEIRLIA